MGAGLRSHGVLGGWTVTSSVPVSAESNCSTVAGPLKAESVTPIVIK